KVNNFQLLHLRHHILISNAHYYHIIIFFFFNVTPPTEIYTLSLHDALPIFGADRREDLRGRARPSRRRALHDPRLRLSGARRDGDRKSTRLNSSHVAISYAVFCLKKKKTKSYDSSSVAGRAAAMRWTNCRKT